jgi:hypothetical protein
LKTPVKTVLPCHDTSFGKPTLTDTNLPVGSLAGGAASIHRDLEPMLTPLPSLVLR